LAFYAGCEEGVNVDSIIAVMNSTSFREFYDNLNKTEYVGKTVTEVLQSLASSDTTGIATYELNFIGAYNYTFIGNQNYLNKIDYVNDEIKLVLGGSDYPNRKKGKLVFLSVLKHSIYYWR
jgi:hypothetical protein